MKRIEPLVTKRTNKISSRMMRKKRRTKQAKANKVMLSSKERISSSTRSWKTSQKDLRSASKKQAKITLLPQFFPNVCSQVDPTTQIPRNSPSQRKNPSSRSTTSVEPTQTAVLVSPAQKNTSITLRKNSEGFNAVIASLNHAMAQSSASWTTLSLSSMKNRRIPRLLASNAFRRARLRKEEKKKSRTRKMKRLWTSRERDKRKWPKHMKMRKMKKRRRNNNNKIQTNRK